MPHQKLHILIFAYWHDRGWKGFVGATVKIWDLAHNMAGLGHDVVLFLPRYDLPKADLPFRLVQIPLLDFPFLRSLSFNGLLAIYLFRRHMKSRPDVVYIRRGISIVPALFARLKRVLLMYEINDDPYTDGPGRRGSPAVRFANWLSVKTDEIVLSWCDAAFVITAEIRDKIIRRLPKIDPHKMCVLPSGANTDLYRPMDKIQCRLTLNLETAGKYIGFMGTLLGHQGVDVLIDAAPQVLRSISDARFVVIGEGPMKDPWRRRVDERSLQGHFLFTGQIDYEKTPVWINAMDICTAPFLRNAGLRSPVKIFDYLACGRPVVASRLPGTTDPFASSGAVWLIEPENSSALADALIDLLQDDENAERMGRLGRELVTNRFSRLQLAREILETVRGLCAQRKAPTP